jgi:hypothetical protein
VDLLINKSVVDNHSFHKVSHSFLKVVPWHTPKLLDRLKCESEVKTAEEQGV